MAKISLRTYNREIESLVEQGQRLDEAIAHCRHILQTYPKHLETYRLLGKAYLEAKRYDQAVDIFQRVLVSAPDDFVSHVGMSIIADDKGKLDDAIWHMERAFEVQPSNAAIQSELQRLFGRRDGVEPPKIRLTRGALAHMYVQGELYNQAIAEVRAVLNGDPKRTDMQTLLARAYFKNGQKTEAADICTELLGKYPYCFDANRIMVEIAPSTQRADAAQEFRQRVVELDPYAAFATESVFHADGVADNAVMIERFEYTGESADVPPMLGIGLDTDSTQISRGVSALSQKPAGTEPAERLPSWLQGASDESSSKQAATPATVSEPDKNDLPEFLRQAGWGAAAAEESAVPFQEPEVEPDANAAVDGDLPEWVKALAPASDDTAPSKPVTPSSTSDVSGTSGGATDQASITDMPDWLTDLGAEGSEPVPAQPEMPKPASEMPPLPPDAPDWLRELGPAPATTARPPAEAADDTPDWLKDLGGRELDEPAVSVKNETESDWIGIKADEQATVPPLQSQEEESPDWLKDFGNDLETPMTKPTAPEPMASKPVTPVTPETPASLGSLGTTAQEQDDAMAWLEGLAAKHGAKPEELVTDPNARTEVAPEWVDKVKEISQPAAEPTPVESESSDETGMWLRGLAAEADTVKPSEPAPQAEEEKPFDFRSSFADQTGFGAEEADVAAQESPIIPEAETPDWLKEMPSQPAESHALEDAPDWLRAARDDAAASAFQEPESAPASFDGADLGAPLAEPADDLPAWLAGLEAEETASAQAEDTRTADDLPSWLQSEAEPEPAAKQPANPADWRPVQPIEPPVSMPQPPAEEPKPAPVAEEKPVPAAPEPVREQAPAPVRAEPVREERPAVVPPPPAPTPARPRPVSAAAKQPAFSLGDAQSQLGRGNIAAALDIYGKLIRKGKSLEDIIRDLRDALYRYPVEVPLWQSLGDAYMRANRLQEALDAYTKAEELLR